MKIKMKLLSYKNLGQNTSRDQRFDQRRRSAIDLRYGQALIEIITGIAVISIFLVGAVLVLTSVLKVGKVNRATQTAQDLETELLDNVRAINTAHWQNIYTLFPKGSSSHYNVTTTVNGLQVVSGDEPLLIDGINFTRYFYTENVCRGTGSGGGEGAGDILGVSDTSSCSVGTEDPSTQRVTARVTWPASGEGQSLSEFISRFSNITTEQVSWLGGPVGDSVAPKATTTFATSSNIDYSSSTGAIQLQNP